MMITTTEIWYIFLTLLVNIKVTCLALESLTKNSIENGATLITEAWTCVSIDDKVVLANSFLSSASSFVESLARKTDVGMTSTMHCQRTCQTLIPLLSKTPNEVLAVTTEGRLFKESSSKTVCLSSSSRQSITEENKEHETQTRIRLLLSKHFIRKTGKQGFSCRREDRQESCLPNKDFCR